MMFTSSTALDFSRQSSTRSPLLSLLPAPSRTTEGETETIESHTQEPTHRVILYNDEWHAIDEVVLQIQKATGYDIYKATSIMLEAHTQGRAVCFRGDRDKCHRVAGILRQIRLQVEVDCD
jgi:ATP-dependent Clp protease adapter protein ClpS